MQSRLYLPKLESPPATILEYLAERFPQIPAPVWRTRMETGNVALQGGSVLSPDAPYCYGLTVLYSKEIPDEPAPVGAPSIVHQDANLLIVDKPHGMVVTPSGDQISRSLLHILQQTTGLTELAPVHRLDRDTAGLVMFAAHTGARAHYHRLFQQKIIRREYRCVAEVGQAPVQREWMVQNCLEKGEPWFRRRISDCGAKPPNAITHIQLLDVRNGRGMFLLRPDTGAKHQLRVHMASLGFPIAGDPLYPEIKIDPERKSPLQLLAWSLSFDDPLSGEFRCFTSNQKLL